MISNLFCFQTRFLKTIKPQTKTTKNKKKMKKTTEK